MADARSLHTNNIVLGSGEAYIDLLDASGARTGERYLGSSPGLVLRTTEERAQVFDDDGPVGIILVDKAISLNHACEVTLKDMSMDNLALRFNAPDGVAAAAVQAANKVVDEEIAVTPGRWYQLGRTDAAPGGVRAIQALDAASAGDRPSLKTSADVAIAQANNWDVDHERGRLYIMPGGAISAGDTIKATYTPIAAVAGAIQRLSVLSTDVKDVLAAFTYLENTDTGKGRNLFIRRGRWSATGETQVKSRNTPQQIQLTGSVEDPGSGVPMVVLEGAP